MIARLQNSRTNPTEKALAISTLPASMRGSVAGLKSLV